MPNVPSFPPLAPATVFAAALREESDIEHQVDEWVRTREGGGEIRTSPSRAADVASALHAAGIVATSPTDDGGDMSRITVGEGPPTWLLHLDAPASLAAYVGLIASVPEVAHAFLWVAATDFATARSAIVGTGPGEIRARADLDAVQGYVEWTGCRRQALAGAAGDELPAPCGCCDNCVDPPAGLLGSDDARSAVAAVVATGERFGVGHLIAVVRGERTDTVAGQQHDRLDVWASGRETSRPDWDAVFRQLLAGGVLAIDEYGGLRTTPLAAAVLADERTISFRRKLALPEAPMPKRRGGPASTARATGGTRAAAPARRSTSARAVEDARRSLYRWRASFAAERGVSPLRVFSDRDIPALVTRRPTTLEDLRRILTPSRCDEFGNDILTAIAELG